MRIRKIEVVGFKSFSDKVILLFDQPITAVVGPNGCGKSNIVDAIRWCMGEQSAHKLRGKAMEDVIFNGSDTRGPSGMAEVSLTFVNDDGQVPIQYSSYHEIVVTRRLFRDGESEYLINKTLVRLRDVVDLFLGTGVSSKAYSIIEQGRIGLVVSAKPEDRRHLIEEAAGITKYKHLRQAAERKMDATRQNLLRLSDLVGEMEQRLGSLKRQAQKAERYKRYRAEMKDLDLWAHAHRFLGIQAEQRVVGERLAEATGLQADVRTDLERRELDLERWRLEAVEEERRLQGMQQEIAELDNRIKLTELTANTHTKDADEIEARAAEDRAEIATVEQQAEEARVGAETAAEEQRAQEESARNESAELADSEDRYRQLREELQGVQAEIEAQRTEQAALVGRVARDDERLEDLSRRRGELETRLLRVRDEGERIDEQLHDARSQAAVIETKLGGLRQLRLALGERREAHEARLDELKRLVSEGEVDLEAQRTELHRRRSRLTSLTEIAQRYEGFQRGVRAVMQQGEASRAGVRALVADILDAPAELEIAVEAVLGERLGSIIVEDHDAAARAVDYLKVNAEGRSSFIPVEVRLAVATLLEEEAAAEAAVEAVRGVAGGGLGTQAPIMVPLPAGPMGSGGAVLGGGAAAGPAGMQAAPALITEPVVWTEMPAAVAEIAGLAALGAVDPWPGVEEGTAPEGAPDAAPGVESIESVIESVVQAGEAQRFEEVILRVAEAAGLKVAPEPEAAAASPTASESVGQDAADRAFAPAVDLQSAVEAIAAAAAIREVTRELLSDARARSARLTGPGIRGPLLELCGYDAGYERVAELLMGDVVVVEDLPTALETWRRETEAGDLGPTLVTLDGDVVDPHGVVTGGSRERVGQGVLQQKREMRELEELIAGLERDLAAASARHLSLKGELHATTRLLEELQRDTHSGEVEIVTQEKDLGRGREECSRLGARRAEIDGELAELREALDAAERDADETARASGEARARLGTIEERLAVLAQQGQDLLERVDGSATRVTDLKVRVAMAQEKVVAARARVEGLAQQAHDHADRLQKLRQGIEDGEARRVELRAQAEEEHARLLVMAGESAERSDKLSSERAAHETRQSEMQIEEVGLRDLRRRSQELADEVQSLELKGHDLQSARARLDETVLERYRLELWREVPDYHLRPLCGPEQEARLRELRELIDRMGEVNLTAIDEFTELETRHEFKAKQKADVEQALEQIEKAIQKINRTSRQRFRETYDAVNTKFQEVFPRLFKGGRARLELTDENDLLETGVEIVAQPPGKKLQSIDLLSGGEKALTAVSLVFAIFLVKPSPFCLLDEVDAPLDEANVGRFNDMIREMTDRSQFIVITHNKRTMAMVDQLYGVTMQEPGCSQIVAVKLSQNGTNSAG
jgi:chromosome segregation protein